MSAESTTPGNGRHRSIVGKVVDDDKAPTHYMSYGKPVPLPAELIGQEFDKKEEEVAACSLRNISKKETRKRHRISNFGLLATIVMGAAFIWKDAEIPRYYRLAMNAPIALWIGFYLSAKAGIWGMSTTGEWDPDSRGIRKAPVEVAKQLWEKAKKVHAAQAIIPLLMTLAFYRSPL